MFEILRQTLHREFECSLVELGMIKDVFIQDGSVALTLALPFRAAPVKDKLVSRVNEAVAGLDANLRIEVNLTEMSPAGMLAAETDTGIKVMSIHLLLPSEDDAVSWRGPLISNVIKQFWNDVVWGDLDYLIVDLPPGTSDASLTVMQSIPLSGVVLVTSPQDLAGMVVRKAAQMAQRMGTPILGLVENMSYLVCPRCGEEIHVFGPSQAMHIAQEFWAPLIGRLPLDPELARCCDSGEIEAYAAESFALIAEEVPGRKTTPIFPRDVNGSSSET